jgi:hypothetical protein
MVNSISSSTNALSILARQAVQSKKGTQQVSTSQSATLQTSSTAKLDAPSQETGESRPVETSESASKRMMETLRNLGNQETNQLMQTPQQPKVSPEQGINAYKQIMGM